MSTTRWVWVVAAVCAGCGDASDELAETPDAAARDAAAPRADAPPPPRGNHAPQLAKPNGRPKVVVGHPSSYDPTQGGTTFSDPDGDALTYTLTLLGPELGLQVVGTTVAGTPLAPAPGDVRTYQIGITATDASGAWASDWFWLDVVDNSPPVAARSIAPHLVAVGAAVSYDPTQLAGTFSDPEGDALTYEVALTTAPHGLSVDGTRVVGRLDAIGMTRGRITALDGHGGRGEQIFAIVAPAPEPPRPSLPATRYVYDDFALPLPWAFRESRLGVIPFWDTTPRDNPTTDAGATLGRVLFYDRRLSITNTVSCGSCHEQARGFASGERFNVGVSGEPLARNALGLTNVRYNINDRFFGDQRVETLERQVLMPIEEPRELGNQLPLLVAKLAATDYYPPLFKAAFGTPEITSERIALALAQFLRSLISYQSRFDHAYNAMDPAAPPDPAAVLTAQELRGREVYIQSNCFACHGHDIHAMDQAANNGLDEVFTDPGAGFGQFRAGSLRNIAKSAPYMHDGRFATLREVIDHYDHDVKDSPNLDAILRVGLYGEPTRLNLSEADKAALEAFLNELTDEAFLTDPKFSDPFR